MILLFFYFRGGVFLGSFFNDWRMLLDGLLLNSDRHLRLLNLNLNLKWNFGELLLLSLSAPHHLQPLPPRKDIDLLYLHFLLFSATILLLSLVLVLLLLADSGLLPRSLPVPVLGLPLGLDILSVVDNCLLDLSLGWHTL
jgi:hypothetical protein